METATKEIEKVLGQLLSVMFRDDMGVGKGGTALSTCTTCCVPWMNEPFIYNRSTSGQRFVDKLQASVCGVYMLYLGYMDRRLMKTKISVLNTGKSQGAPGKSVKTKSLISSKMYLLL